MGLSDLVGRGDFIWPIFYKQKAHAWNKDSQRWNALDLWNCCDSRIGRMVVTTKPVLNGPVLKWIQNKQKLLEICLVKGIDTLGNPIGSMSPHFDDWSLFTLIFPLGPRSQRVSFSYPNNPNIPRLHRTRHPWSLYPRLHRSSFLGRSGSFRTTVDQPGLTIENRQCLINGHFRNRFIGGTYHIYKAYVRAM